MVPLMGLLFLAGLVPYLYFPIRLQAHPAINSVSGYYDIDLASLGGLWWMISAQAYRFFMFGYAWQEIPGQINAFISFLWRNFLGAGVVLGLLGEVYGLIRKWKLYAGFVLLLLPTTIFYINYKVVDKDTMFLAVYLIWAILIAQGIKTIDVLIQRGFSKQFPPGRLICISYSFSIALMLLTIILNWKWVDMSSFKGPSLFAQHVFNSSQPDSIILGQWSSATVLEYFQIVEGKRPDLIIYNRSRSNVAYYYNEWKKGTAAAEILKKMSSLEIERIDQELTHRTVYSIEYDATLNEFFDFIPQGDIYKLK